VSQQSPTFRSGVSYVEIDAVVTDKSGHFVGSLGRDDFVVFEDGKRQDLSVVSLIQITRSTVAATDETAVVPHDSRQAADAADDTNRRWYLIVLDVMHVDPTRTPLLRRRAVEFIEKYLDPFDRAAVVQIGYPGTGPVFTSVATALVAAVERAIGEKAPSEAVANPNADPDLLAAP